LKHSKHFHLHLKAGKMGGLLMKAKKDGSLEARVEKMETELGDDA
tara:strand:+ start:108 stop:242 length:135 start_codon:yes stop_codon:yes gene_type:complete